MSKRCCGNDTWGVYEDFREMIDKEKLDAVMVETTTRAGMDHHPGYAGGNGRVV